MAQFFPGARSQQVRCPAQDADLSVDPYGSGLVACQNCGCQYHRPCAEIFVVRGCARCAVVPMSITSDLGARQVEPVARRHSPPRTPTRPTPPEATPVAPPLPAYELLREPSPIRPQLLRLRDTSVVLASPLALDRALTGWRTVTALAEVSNALPLPMRLNDVSSPLNLPAELRGAL